MLITIAMHKTIVPFAENCLMIQCIKRNTVLDRAIAEPNADRSCKELPFAVFRFHFDGAVLHNTHTHKQNCQWGLHFCNVGILVAAVCWIRSCHLRNLCLTLVVAFSRGLQIQGWWWSRPLPFQWRVPRLRLMVKIREKMQVKSPNIWIKTSKNKEFEKKIKQEQGSLLLF